MTDHLSSLGPDEVSRVAVVGAFMQFGLTVAAADEPITPSWYKGKINALTWGKNRSDPGPPDRSDLSRERIHGID